MASVVSLLPESLRVSLREHSTRVAQRWWVLIVSFVGGVLFLIDQTVPRTTVQRAGRAVESGPLIPTWLWMLLLLGGIIVAQFLAFHDVRKERDEVKAEMESRFDSIRYRFQMNALRGGPRQRIAEVGADPEDGYRLWFEFLNGGEEALEYEVEHVAIVLGATTAPTETDLESASGIIFPGRIVEFYYNWIPGSTNPPQMGTGEYSVVYGHPSGGKRFRAKHKFHVGWNIKADPQGNIIEVEASWVTIGRVSHEPV